jgi:large subunit ribosomal protein L18
MIKSQQKTEKRDRRKKRIRAKISGVESCPRLSIFKSNTAIYAQAIDDKNGKTLASFDSRKSKGKNLLEKSSIVGLEIAKQLLSKNIDKVVFDRGGYMYTGSIKAVADGARSAGLKF